MIGETGLENLDGPPPAAVFRRLHAHIPLPALRKRLPLFVDLGINPEIYLSHKVLEALSESEMEETAALLRERGLKTTVHGPFYDLSPGAVDPAFRALTVRRMAAALRAARLFAPDCVVFHPGYDPLRFAEYRDVWLRNSLRTWSQLLPLAEEMPSTSILIENIFEREPGTIADLLGSLPSPPFGFCLDVGHFHLFSDAPLAAWMEALGPRLREVHLHDNNGLGDEHLPPGEGGFDFPALIGLLGRLEEKVIGTVEAHSEADLLAGLAWLKKGPVARRP